MFAVIRGEAPQTRSGLECGGRGGGEAASGAREGGEGVSSSVPRWLPSWRWGARGGPSEAGLCGLGCCQAAGA